MIVSLVLWKISLSVERYYKMQRVDKSQCSFVMLNIECFFNNLFKIAVVASDKQRNACMCV